MFNKILSVITIVLAMATSIEMYMMINVLEGDNFIRGLGIFGIMLSVLVILIVAGSIISKKSDIKK